MNYIMSNQSKLSFLKKTSEDYEMSNELLNHGTLKYSINMLLEINIQLVTQ